VSDEHADNEIETPEALAAKHVNLARDGSLRTEYVVSVFDVQESFWSETKAQNFHRAMIEELAAFIRTQREIGEREAQAKLAATLEIAVGFEKLIGCVAEHDADMSMDAVFTDPDELASFRATLAKANNILEQP